MHSYFLRSFELPSRFTFLERHVMAIKALAKCLQPRDTYQILDVGPGVFEPFVLGSIVERWTNKRVQRIDAVDQDSHVCDMLARLMRREPVSIKEIAAVSTNFEASGVPRRNRDLASAERLAKAVVALEEQGIPAGRWFQHDYRMFLPDTPFRVQIRQKDIASFIFSSSAGMYDLAFFGAVLVNMIKVKTPEQITTILNGLHDRLSSGAVFGITTTPKEFLEPSGTLQWVQNRGFRLVCIFVERLLVLPDDDATKIHGDTVAIFRRKEDSLDPGPYAFREELYARLSSHPDIQAVKSDTWKRASGDWWHERWFPIGWIPDHESGCEFLLDLSKMLPGDQYLFSDIA